MKRGWYGYQTMLIDGASVLAIALLFAMNRDGIAWGLGSAGGVGLFLGAAAVHGCHGQRKRALLSFLARLSAVGVGGLVGWGTSQSCTGMYCQLEGVLIGGCVSLVALLICVVVDAAVARDPAVRSVFGRVDALSPPA